MHRTFPVPPAALQCRCRRPLLLLLLLLLLRQARPICP
jgi:hypothetical protein